MYNNIKTLSEINSIKIKYKGNIAKYYDIKRENNPVTIEDGKMIDLFVNMINSGALFIDVPCGTGRAAETILNKDHKYYGVDISIDMLDICKNKLGDNINAKLFVADASNLPFKDNEGDYLICIKLIKWLQTDEMVLKALKEFRRVCSDMALINVKLNPSKQKKKGVKYIVREIIDKFKKLFLKRKYGNVRSLDKDHFENLCKKAGWIIFDKFENISSNGIVWNYILK